ncbi:hypothetical protein Q5752_006462 [Cryptotrichosporon argae]
MSDALSDDAWLNSFATAPPRQLLSALQRREAVAHNHVAALAELYKERAAIEAEYAARLQKLARTAEQGGLVGKGGNEWERGSGEEKTFNALVSELSETSSSHSTLSALIRTDFEQPLRELPSKIVAWRRISDQESTLDKTLRDYEKVSAKLEKASGKKSSSKADALSSELQQLTGSLASLSPMVYTTYQKLDEDRLRAIKEIIIRWGTVRADQAARDGERADRSVAALIAWETADEVAAVGRRLGGSGASGRGGSAAPSLSAVGTPTSNRRLSTVSHQNNGDFSPRPAPRTNGSSGTVPTSGFAGGLKSMLGRKSTVVGRQRSGSEATSTRSGRRDVDLISEEVPPIPAPNVDADGFSVAPADRHRAPWDEPTEVLATPTLAPTSTFSPPSAQAGFAQTFTSSPNESTDSVPAPTSPSAGAPGKLNLALSTAPIRESDAEREAAVARMQASLALPPSQPNRRSTIARGRRDVRNTMFASGDDAPNIQAGFPGGSSAGSAFGDMGALSESPVESAGGTLNGARPEVSRQGSRNPFDSPSLAAPLAPTATGIHASPALNGSASGAGEGLRASMAETINVLFREGAVSRVQITGEIYVSLRPGVATGPIHLRLTAFEALEKVAPNPAFLAQVPDRPGEYFLDPERLAADAGAAAKGTLLFKYQVHVSAASADAFLPLKLTPAYQIKDGETRMILTYASARPLSDLVLSALFGPEPDVANVQAKPPGGVWSPSSRRMTWRVPSAAAAAADGKIVARFVSEAGRLEPVSVSAGFAVSDVVSGLGIEVVDGAQLAEVRKGAVAGKYAVEAVV